MTVSCIRRALAAALVSALGSTLAGTYTAWLVAPAAAVDVVFRGGLVVVLAIMLVAVGVRLGEGGDVVPRTTSRDALGRQQPARPVHPATLRRRRWEQRHAA